VADTRPRWPRGAARPDFPTSAVGVRAAARLWPIARHLVHLVEGVAGARHWRRQAGGGPLVVRNGRARSAGAGRCERWSQGRPLRRFRHRPSTACSRGGDCGLPSPRCRAGSADGPPSTRSGAARPPGSGLVDAQGERPSALRPAGPQWPGFRWPALRHLDKGETALAAGFALYRPGCSWQWRKRKPNSSGYITLLCMKGKITYENTHEQEGIE